MKEVARIDDLNEHRVGDYLGPAQDTGSEKRVYLRSRLQRIASIELMNNFVE